MISVKSDRTERAIRPLLYVISNLRTTMVNEYSGITDYYDLLVMSGYYNYQKIAREAHSIIGSGCRILELGVGRGLLVEE